MKVYGYFDEVPDKEILHTGYESKVQQHMAADCDMKVIMERFLKTGTVPQISPERMSFIDATSAEDYDRSLQLVIDAESSFNDLPSKIRNKFDNDPSKFLSFMNDDKNLDEAVELGLVKRDKSVSGNQDAVGENDNELAADSAERVQGGEKQTSPAKQGAVKSESQAS